MHGLHKSTYFGEKSGFLAALHSIHPNSDPSSFLADKDKDKDIETLRAI